MRLTLTQVNRCPEEILPPPKYQDRIRLVIGLQRPPRTGNIGGTSWVAYMPHGVRGPKEGIGHYLRPKLAYC